MKEGDEGLLPAANMDVLPLCLFLPLKYPFFLLTKLPNSPYSTARNLHEAPRNRLRIHLRVPQRYGCGSGARLLCSRLGSLGMDALPKCILKGLPTDPKEDGKSEKPIQSYIP